MRKPSAPSIAVLYPASVPWMARCLDGIRHYAREHGDWHLICSPPTLRGAEESELTLSALRGWKGDAIIAVINDRRELHRARSLGLPIVNLAGGPAKSEGIPRVMVDHVEGGRLAAQQLLNRGLRKLAFFGWKDVWYSEQRLKGFSERAAEAGLTSKVFLRLPRGEARLAWPERVAGVARWLASLPRPVGIFAVHDYRAQLLMEACHEAGLRIPADVAVIGFDNDETICEHMRPTLTSISRSSAKVGWEAAALLDQLMRGKRPPAEDRLIAPDMVVARQSTDMLYCEEPVVQRSLDYLRANLARQFNVDELAEQVGVSKRTLEMRFRDGLQTSPHEFISQIRVQHAQSLLRMPDQRSAAHLARECGFGTARALYKAYHRITGAPLTTSKRANPR